MVHWVGS